MTRLDLGPVGATLDVVDRPGHLDDAAELERLGYSTLWVPGGQLQSLRPLRDLLDATASVRVGSSIIPAEVHDADAVAATHADLAAAHPGRFVAGLGGAQGPRPMQVLSAYLDDLDAASPPVPASRRVLAALGPRKLALARDRTAGALTLLVTPEYTAQARAALGPDGTLAVQHFVVLDDDAEAARSTARGPLGMLSGVAGYRANFARMGFTDADVDELRDDLVDALVAWGDAAAVAAQLRTHLDAGADHVAVSVLPTPARPDPREAWRQLAGELVGVR